MFSLDEKKNLDRTMKPNRFNNIELKKNIEDMDFNVERCSNLLSSILNLHEKVGGAETNKSDKNNKPLVQSEKKQNFLKRSLTSKSIPSNVKQSTKKTNFILSNKQQTKSAVESTKPHTSITTSKRQKQKSILKKCNSKSNEFLHKISPKSQSIALSGSEVSCCSASSLASLSKLKSKSVEGLEGNKEKTVAEILPSNTVYIKVIDQLLRRLNVNSKEAKHTYLSRLISDSDNFKKSDVPAEKQALTFDQHPIKLKLDEMTLELNDLKKELNIVKSPKMNFLPKNLNTLVEQKLMQMKKQIVDLTDLQRGGEEGITHQKNGYENEMEIIQLKKELKESNHRCQVLEHSLEQKTRQTDQYFTLFRDISENVNKLTKDFECKKELRLKPFKASRLDYMNKKKSLTDSADIQANILSLKQHLVRFQSKVKDQYGSYFMPAINEQLNNLSKASDTLIDADSSFQSIDSDIHSSVSTKPFQKFDVCPKSVFGLRANNGINIAMSEAYEDDDDDDDESRIQMAMDDFTITTIATEDLVTDSDVLTDDSEDGNQVRAKNDKFNGPGREQSEDHEFQKDLLKLDQKISKVKQALESMKSI